jgi:hypothetical protein
MESLKNISQSSSSKKKSPLTLKRKRKSSSPKRKVSSPKRKVSSSPSKRKGSSSPSKRKGSSPKRKRKNSSPIKLSSKKNFEEQFFMVIKTDKKILNVECITQINLEGKLITIIGETHLLNSTKVIPTTNNITIDEFILERIKNNDNIKIMLEYIPEIEDVNNIQSKNINLIYNTLLKDKKHVSKIIPFDKRLYFLNYETYRDYLLGSKEFENIKFIIDGFIEPFYKYFSYFNFDHNSYTEKNIDFLIKYLKSIDDNLRYIFDIINTQKYNMIEIKSKLHTEWIKVCDFFVLIEILKEKDKISEYIILIGDRHRQHLEDIFKNEIIAKTNNGNLSGLYYHKNKIYDELKEMALSHHLHSKK